MAGIDLINHVNSVSGAGTQSDKGYGIVTPLLTTATGEKFGKSAGNAVSLDESVTNVFDFYQASMTPSNTTAVVTHAHIQFFLRTADADVGRYLKMFTLLPVDQIDDVMATHQVSLPSLAWHPALNCVSAPPK